MTTPHDAPGRDFGPSDRDLSQRDGDRDKGFKFGSKFFNRPEPEVELDPKIEAELARRRLLMALATQGRGATLLSGPAGPPSAASLIQPRAVGL